MCKYIYFFFKKPKYMSKIYTINNQNVKFPLLTHIRVVSIGN